MSADERQERTLNVGKAKVEGMDSVSSGCRECDCCYLCFKEVVLRAETGDTDCGPNVLLMLSEQMSFFSCWCDIEDSVN